MGLLQVGLDLLKGLISVLFSDAAPKSARHVKSQTSKHQSYRQKQRAFWHVAWVGEWVSENTIIQLKYFTMYTTLPDVFGHPWSYIFVPIRQLKMSWWGQSRLWWRRHRRIPGLLHPVVPSSGIQHEDSSDMDVEVAVHFHWGSGGILRLHAPHCRTLFSFLPPDLGVLFLVPSFSLDTFLFPLSLFQIQRSKIFILFCGGYSWTLVSLVHSQECHRLCACSKLFSLILSIESQ